MKLTSRFNKKPLIAVKGKEDACATGWPSIERELKAALDQRKGKDATVVIETYHGVHLEELRSAMNDIFQPDRLIDSATLFKPENEVRTITYPDVTDDRVFGYMTRLHMEDLMDPDALERTRQEESDARGLTVIFGYGASLACDKPDLLVYADMARWEIQQRQRRNEVDNLGITNRDEHPELKYKRGFFVDWRICDRLKKRTMTGGTMSLTRTILPARNWLPARRSGTDFGRLRGNRSAWFHFLTRVRGADNG